MEEEGRVRLLEGDGEFLPDIHARVVSGHTPGQQVILVGEAEGPRLLYAADLIPFASQIRISWIMAFDLNPLLTLQEKKELLARAVLEGWVLVFEHDPEIEAAKVEYADGQYRMAEEVAL
jgi:glyoxylase-like metal-dependent hydrolase (beta-lactamase superfamily II)